MSGNPFDYCSWCGRLEDECVCEFCTCCAVPSDQCEGDERNHAESERNAQAEDDK